MPFRSLLFFLTFAIGVASFGGFAEETRPGQLGGESRFTAVIRHGEERLDLEAQGEPFSNAVLHLFTAPVNANGVPNGPIGVAAIPIRFNGNGRWDLEFDLRFFEQHPDADFYLSLEVPGTASDPLAPSDSFLFSLRHQQLSDPSAPMSVGGGQHIGQSPEGRPLVSSWSHLLSHAQPVHWLRMTCVPHGVEGVIPVN